MASLISTEDLCEWFKCKQPTKLATLLRERNIPYTTNAKGWPITTDIAITDSLRGKRADEEINF